MTMVKRTNAGGRTKGANKISIVFVHQLGDDDVTCKHNSDRIESLLYNPIEQAGLFDPLSNDLNPDSNFLTRLPTSRYMVEEDINDQVSSFNEKSMFSILHLNARSLLKNLDQLNLILKNLNRAFSVLGVSETWLTNSTAELVNITGYNFVSNHRKSKIGGGVGIYLQNDIEYKILKECKFSDSEVIESIFVEIIVPQGKNIIVGCVYRPPNQNTALFLEKFNDILTIITTDNKHCYVMGDFNLDLLQYNHHVPTQEFIDSLFSHAFFPLISNPTRLTSYSATLIDNIFTNNLSQHVFNGIVLNDLSDHLPVFTYFGNETLTRTEKKILSRAISAINLEKFNENLSNTNWSLFIKEDDPNEAYNDFISEFSRIYEICFPLKVIKGKQMNKFYSPWLSRGLLKSINKKNRLYKKLVQSPTTSCELKYKAYKNKLNHLIRIAKRTYYDSKLEDAKNDLRTTWKLLNEVINKRKNNPVIPIRWQNNHGSHGHR